RTCKTGSPYRHSRGSDGVQFKLPFPWQYNWSDVWRDRQWFYRHFIRVYPDRRPLPHWIRFPLLCKTETRPRFRRLLGRGEQTNECLNLAHFHSGNVLLFFHEEERFEKVHKLSTNYHNDSAAF